MKTTDEYRTPSREDIGQMVAMESDNPTPYLIVTVDVDICGDEEVKNYHSSTADRDEVLKLVESVNGWGVRRILIIENVGGIPTVRDQWTSGKAAWGTGW